MPTKTNFASSTNASEKFFFQCRLGLIRVFPPEISCIGIFGADWSERFISVLCAAGHSPSALAARGGVPSNSIRPSSYIIRKGKDKVSPIFFGREFYVNDAS